MKDVKSLSLFHKDFKRKRAREREREDKLKELDTMRDKTKRAKLK